MGPFRRWLPVLAGVALVGVIVLGAALRVLGERVEERFRGRLFAVPSRVYSAPLVLYPGLDVERVGLLRRLQRLQYHEGKPGQLERGEYARLRGEIRIDRRPFRHAHGEDPGGTVVIRLDGAGGVRALLDGRGRELDTLELEPELVAELHGPDREMRHLIAAGEVPASLLDAVIEVEDRSFFRHRGLDLRRVIGAALANLRAGEIVQGGSTLTQQLVKNLYLSQEQTLRRKLVEAGMALMLERRHSKEEILAAYLNELYMGQRGSVSIHGMGEAARFYFAKDVADLTLAESALLAGMIRGPALYAPDPHPERARQRRDLVLDLLLERDRIDEQMHREARAADLGVREYVPQTGEAPWFVDHLRRDLERVYGEEVLQSEGLSIFTTLDPRLQRAANHALQSGLERLERDLPRLRREVSPLQAALVALHPATGEILALVGGRDWRRSQFDRATQARRQPGSVFKPIVAAAALARQNGRPPEFTLVSVLDDEPLSVQTPAGRWEPQNYDETFRGPVTLREAVEHSLNVPIARLGLALGPERIVSMARRMGIESRLEPLPSLALGATEVSVLEVARAYAVLASGGVRPELRAWAEVMDEHGELLERRDLEFERVLQPAEAWLVTSMLRGAVDRGTAHGLREYGFRGDVAGKTGTSSRSRDAWFVGFTPTLLVAVWVGFDDEGSLGLPGAAAALPIFADFLMAAEGRDGMSRFVPPLGIEAVRVPALDGVPGSPDCWGEPELFLAGTAPEDTCERGGDGVSPRDPVERFLDWLRSEVR